MAMKHVTAVVTGAAGGIGMAIVRRLLDDGYQVAALDVTPGSLLEAGDQNLSFYQTDIGDLGEVEKIAVEIGRKGHPVKTLVNCAGLLQDPESLETMDVAAHERIWRVNYGGVFNSCRVFAPSMAVEGGGAIVNVTSINAHASTPLLAYAPGKAAVASLTACLAAEFGRSGVRVNAVAPGFTLTDPLRRKIEGGLRDEKRILESTCLGEWVLPKDIAAAVAFLISEDARTITGTSLVVDAGWTAGVTWSTFGGVRPARLD